MRIIARLDIKNDSLIKGVQMEGLRKLGQPNHYAKKYYAQGVDELIYIDCVASLYQRNGLLDIISEAASNIYVPITVGGGVRTTKDVHEILRSGADKVAINTAAIENPNLISEIARIYGKQCIVLSIEAKQVSSGHWNAFTNNGREDSGLDVLEWIKTGASLGAGEILLTSVDNDGTRKGFDMPLIHAATTIVNVPVIISGGMGKPADLIQASKAGADGIAVGSILHYDKYSVSDIKKCAKENHIEIRP